MSEKYTFVPFSNITLQENSFWGDRQEMNRKTTIYAIYDRFKDTGRFDAFNFSWKPGDPDQPHIFWDSDIAKWIEAAAHIIRKNPDPHLEAIADSVVDLIEKNQDPSGYFNLYFTMVEPQSRWQKRTEHELYCAGHLMEAAAAYYEATGKTKFLRLMCRYADHIEEVFKIKKSAAFITPGHPEIELALVKLYKVTGKKRYLELSRFFIDERGRHEEPCYGFALPAYDQHHKPLREQSTAEGHSVRAAYLYSGMADIAYHYNDKELFDACRRIFENIVYKRMYITGGIGSSHRGEAFTIDYDLPNLTAYTESCAAIALAFFAQRMLRLDADSLYADIIERIIYNGFLSSISLDGRSFFYENPLEIQPRLFSRDASVKDKEHLPLAERQEVFGCSCCPPNIARFIASIAEYLYSYDTTTFFIHQYMSSTAMVDGGKGNFTVNQKTYYPEDGKINISLSGFNMPVLALRIPGWCESFIITVDGHAAEYTVNKGYAYLKNISPDAQISLDFVMDVKLIEASPYVRENSGRAAVQRGPVIFCAEAVDNGPDLRDIRIPVSAEFTTGKDEKYGFMTLLTKAWRRDPESFRGELYRPVPKASGNLIPCEIKLIPYYAFANRGVSEMIVWFEIMGG